MILFLGSMENLSFKEVNFNGKKKEYFKIYCGWNTHFFNGIFNVRCTYISCSEYLGGDSYVSYNLAKND